MEANDCAQKLVKILATSHTSFTERQKQYAWFEYRYFISCHLICFSKQKRLEAPRCEGVLIDNARTGEKLKWPYSEQQRFESGHRSL